MLKLVGDLHGEFKYLPTEGTILQVGDFGFWQWRKDAWFNWQKEHQKANVFFIDGNHEFHPALPHNAGEPIEVWPRLFYIPRGIVVELEGLRIGCLGGGRSPDEKWRKPYVTVFPEEVVTAQQSTRLLEQKVDLLVTHVPPQRIIDAHFERAGFLKFFELPENWSDLSCYLVESIHNLLGRPPLVCGHMHRSLQDGEVRILNIGEVMEYDGS